MGSTPAGREDARIEEVDGQRGSDSQPAEPPLSKRPPPEPSQPTRRWLGSRRLPKRDKALTSEKPPRFRGGSRGLLPEARIALLARLQSERGRGSLRRRLSRKLSSRASLGRRARIWWTTRWSRRRGGLKMWLKQGQVTSRRAGSLHRRSREKRACLEERVREQVLLLRVGD